MSRGGEANHNNFSSKSHSPHFFIRATLKSSFFQYYFQCQTLADKILFENLAILEHKLNIEFAQKNFICEIRNFLCNFFFTNKHLYSSGKDEDFEVAWTRKEENVFSTRNCCSCSSSPPIRLHNNGPG